MGVLEQVAVFFLTFPQFLLRPLALGNVLRDLDGAYYGILLVFDGIASH